MCVSVCCVQRDSEFLYTMRNVLCWDLKPQDHLDLEVPKGRDIVVKKLKKLGSKSGHKFPTLAEQLKE